MQHLQGQVDQNDIDYITQRYGAPVLGLPCPTKNGKINPHVSRFLLANGKMADVFHIKPVYYETIDGKWRPLSEVTSHHGNTRLDLLSGWEEKMSLPYLRWLLQRMELINGKVSIPYPLIGLKHIREGREIFLTTSTFYPDPNVETTSVDGYVNNSGTVFATVQGASSGSSVDSTTDMYIQTEFATPTYTISRIFTLFDTSAIPDTDTINSAIYSLYIVGRNSVDTDSVRLITVTPASNVALVAGDYSQVGTVAQATDLTIMGLTASAYNDWTLNATGLGNISKTSITKFGVREVLDINISAPTGQNYFQSNTAETAGTTQDPKLVVVHSAGAIAINVSDSISITESVIIEMNSFINVNDQITITEGITVANSQLGNISVSDQIIITENVTVDAALVHYISVNDSVTISESITASAPQLGNISVNDQITITESITLLTPDVISGIALMRSKENEWPLGMDDETIL